MKVISILNSKGGVGKTTTSIHLARGLQLRGKDVAVFDTDIQGSAIAWSAVGGVDPALPVEAAEAANIESRLKKYRPVEYAIIDGAAKLLPEQLIPTLVVSDVVLMPVQPSPLDIWGCAMLASTVKQLAATGRPRGYFLVSRQIIGSALAGGIQDALEAQGVPVLSSRLSQRVAYAEALAAGVTVLESEPNGKAAEEVEALVTEILNLK